MHITVKEVAKWALLQLMKNKNKAGSPCGHAAPYLKTATSNRFAWSDGLPVAHDNMVRAEMGWHLAVPGPGGCLSDRTHSLTTGTIYSTAHQDS